MDEAEEWKVPVHTQEIFRQKAVDGDATFAIAYALMELAKKLNLHGVRTELKGAGVETCLQRPPEVCLESYSREVASAGLPPG